jgi:hypothetical protein
MKIKNLFLSLTVAATQILYSSTASAGDIKKLEVSADILSAVKISDMIGRGSWDSKSVQSVELYEFGMQSEASWEQVIVDFLTATERTKGYLGRICRDYEIGSIKACSRFMLGERQDEHAKATLAELDHFAAVEGVDEDSVAFRTSALTIRAYVAAFLESAKSPDSFTEATVLRSTVNYQSVDESTSAIINWKKKQILVLGTDSGA